MQQVLAWRSEKGSEQEEKRFCLTDKGGERRVLSLRQKRETGRRDRLTHACHKMERALTQFEKAQ